MYKTTVIPLEVTTVFLFIGLYHVKPISVQKDCTHEREHGDMLNDYRLI